MTIRPEVPFGTALLFSSKFLQTTFQSLLAIRLEDFETKISSEARIHLQQECQTAFQKHFIVFKSISDVTIQTFKVGQIVVKQYFSL
jgi:hypothetical protein